MPHWLVLLAAALGAWLLLSVGGGFVIGRGLDLIARRLHQRRRPDATAR
jgi:hypothetical protein